MQIVQTAVAQQHHFARNGKMLRVHVAVIVDGEMHVDVGVAHVGILHVGEKLLVEMIVKGVCAFGQALERQLECGKLSHDGVC